MRLSFIIEATSNTFRVSQSFVICGHGCCHNCSSYHNNSKSKQLRRWSQQKFSRVGALPRLLLLQHPRHPSNATKINNPRSFSSLTSQRPKRATSDGNGNDNHQDGECSNDSKKNRDSIWCTPSDIMFLMDSLNLPVDEDLHISLIKECTESRNVNEGANIHSHIERSYRSHLYRAEGRVLANRLIIMYAACGHPKSALELFDQMLSKDATSWAAIIGVMSDSGNHTGALQIFMDMCARGGTFKLIIDPSGCWLDALMAALRSCTDLQEVVLGLQIHGLVLKVIGRDNPFYSGHIDNSLVQLYSILGHHESAANVLERTRPQDAAAWTSMIVGYCRQLQFRKAVDVFNSMGRAGIRRNCHATSSTLMACARIVGDGGLSGKQVHANAIKAGASANQFVGSSLINMYMKHGLVEEAEKAFEMMDGSRDLVCWSSMLIGYARRGCSTQAVSLLHAMKASGIRPQEMVVDKILTAI